MRPAAARERTLIGYLGMHGCYFEAFTPLFYAVLACTPFFLANGTNQGWRVSGQGPQDKQRHRGINTASVRRSLRVVFCVCGVTRLALCCRTRVAPTHRWRGAGAAIICSPNDAIVCISL